jgi:hypothetical protein
MAAYDGSYADVYDKTTQLVSIVPAQYGIHAITLRRNRRAYTNVRFWPCAPITQLDDLGQFAFHDPQEVRIPGITYVSSRVGRSGRSMVVRTFGVKRESVYLVQYTHGATSLHKLQLPSSPDLLRFNSVALDDHRGIVYLSTKSGTLLRIPFA